MDVRRGAMPSLSARVAAAAAETSARAAPANGAKLLTARQTANREPLRFKNIMHVVRVAY